MQLPPPRGNIRHLPLPEPAARQQKTAREAGTAAEDGTGSGHGGRRRHGKRARRQKTVREAGDSVRPTPSRYRRKRGRSARPNHLRTGRRGNYRDSPRRRRGAVARWPAPPRPQQPRQPPQEPDLTGRPTPNKTPSRASGPAPRQHLQPSGTRRISGDATGHPATGRRQPGDSAAS